MKRSTHTQKKTLAGAIKKARKKLTLNTRSLRRRIQLIGKNAIPFGCLTLSSKIKLNTLYILLKSTIRLDAPTGLDAPAGTT